MYESIKFKHLILMWTFLNDIAYLLDITIAISNIQYPISNSFTNKCIAFSNFSSCHLHRNKCLKYYERNCDHFNNIRFSRRVWRFCVILFFTRISKETNKKNETTWYNGYHWLIGRNKREYSKILPLTLLMHLPLASYQ